MFHHFDRAKHTQLNTMTSDTEHLSEDKYIRVAHLEPVHDDVQVQVFGAVQVPLF